MKQLNTFLTALVFVLAGFTGVANAETGFSKSEVIPRTGMSPRQVIFSKMASNHVERKIERDLSHQADAVLAGLYEAPTSVTFLEIDIEQ